VDFPQEGQADVLLVHCGFYQGTAGRTVVNDISTATMHHIDSFSVPRSEATWNEFVDMLFNTYSVVVTNLPSIKLTLAQQGAFEVNGHTWVNKPGSLSEHGLCGRVVKADNQEVLQEVRGHGCCPARPRWRWAGDGDGGDVACVCGGGGGLRCARALLQVWGRGESCAGLRSCGVAGMPVWVGAGQCMTEPPGGRQSLHAGARAGVLLQGLCSTLKQFGRMMLAWRARSVPETPQRAEPASDNQQQPQMMQQ
jgi:hypothetical protein